MGIKKKNWKNKNFEIVCLSDWLSKQVLNSDLFKTIKYFFTVNRFDSFPTYKNELSIVNYPLRDFKTLHFMTSPLYKYIHFRDFIWKTKKIPYGETKSYGDIAKKVNTSPRYVGNVCGQNQHLIVIPCHRVVRSDGTLGGFSGAGGLNLKKRLINFEKS